MNTKEKRLQEAQKRAKDMEETMLKRQMPNESIAVDEQNKTAKFVMSRQTRDRHDEIIMQDSWILEHFKKAPRFFFQHKSEEMPLGSWTDVGLVDDPEVEDAKKLVGTAEFATEIYDKADLAFKMVKEGHLNSVSVGFIPHNVEYNEDEEVFELRDAELYEGSLVGVPSNRDTLLDDGKSADDDGVSARQQAIAAKNKLDQKIKRAKDDKVIEDQIARENLNKAIRKMK